MITHYCFAGVQEVPCRVSIMTWIFFNAKRNFETCSVEINEINDENYTASTESDSSVVAFQIKDKPGVKFLPKNFSDFSDLTAIQCRNSSVSSIGNYFKGLLKLRFIDLGFNLIKNVDDETFTELVSLEYLNLAGNKIDYLGEKVFCPLKELKELHLSSNKLHTLHPKVFSSLVNVQFINLFNNKIFALPVTIFENATSLKNISIATNRLEALPVMFFKNNLKLEIIWLESNNMEFIDFDAFNHLRMLKVVNLKSNTCIDKIYDETTFISLSNDLKQSCNENTMTESRNLTAAIPKKTANKGPGGLSLSIEQGNVIFKLVLYDLVRLSIVPILSVFLATSRFFGLFRGTNIGPIAMKK